MSNGEFTEFGGSLTADVLHFNPDAIPEPDTLYICMTRGERRIADELRKQFGGFERVIIDVDGERHEFSADSLIRLLEGYEGAHDKSRWYELFGTPERAARVAFDMHECSLGMPIECDDCAAKTTCASGAKDYDALLEWLNQEVDA